MTDNWDFFFSDFGDEPAVVRLDLSAGDEAPIADLPWLLRIDVSFVPDPDTGAPTESERIVLGEIEDQFSAWIEAQQNGAFIASVLLPERRSLVAYLASNAITERSARTAMTAAEGRPLTLEFNHDPEWNTYFLQLYPNEQQQRWMADRQLVSFMESQGDQLEVPRQVDFTAFFSSETDRDNYLREALALGYQPEPEGNPSIYSEDATVEGESEEAESLDEFEMEELANAEDTRAEYPFTLTVVRETPVDLESIYAFTEELSELARKHTGLFDGWACFPVVPENDEANRRRSENQE